MDPRYSLKKYPRADNLYKSKSSLDFQLISANVYVNRKKNKGESAVRWIIHLIIGLVIGIIAFYMSIMEEELIDIKKEYTQKLVDKFPVEYGYLFWASFSVLFALIGVVITVYIGPGASGSGVPEVIGMMNGVRYPKAIDIATLFVKIIGVEMAVIGNLAVGKEGPLVHIGAIIGAMTPYIPLDCFAPFRNDSDKRTFIAAGCSAGVSAAFGAPIGGALFTYEISKPNTFWTFSMLWRVFFSAAVATLTLGLCNELFTGVPMSLNSSSVLKFGEISYFDTPMFDAVIAVGLGIFCGILGAFFIYMYAKLGFFRKKFINTPFKKIAEVIFFSLISATVFYWLSAGCNLCYPQDPLSEFTNYVSFTCPSDQYNPQATLFLNSEGAVIRALMNDKITDTTKDLAYFTIVWYILMITTAGVWVPSGLFVPGMIVGSGLGLMLKQILGTLEVNQNPLLGSSYQIMGATAFMASYTRQTYSLAVIMLETTQTINFFIPIMLVVLVSVGVAGIFNRPLYDRALRVKNIPMLRNHCPRSQQQVTAFQIMAAPVVTVEGIISVEYLREILQHDFSSFPVLNSAGNMVGMIPKNFLITLIKHHFWLDETQLSERQKAKLPRMYRKLSEFGLTADQLMQNLEEQNQDFEVTRRKAERTAKPTITQNDWFMREFDKEEVKEYKNFQLTKNTQNTEELKTTIKKALLQDEKNRVLRASMIRSGQVNSLSKMNMSVDTINENDIGKGLDAPMRQDQMRKSAPFKSFEATNEQDKEGSKAPLLIPIPEESAPTNLEHEEPVATKSKFRIANLPSLIFGTNKTENEEEKPEIVREVEERKKILGQFTMLQDVTEIPISRKILDWRHFNANYYSNDLTYEEVAGICEDHLDRMIDVRPYMIETPFVAQSTDRLQKILDIFRNMHLRSLPVINPGSGSLDGIITRQDIFAYMSL